MLDRFDYGIERFVSIDLGQLGLTVLIIIEIRKTQRKRHRILEVLLLLLVFVLLDALGAYVIVSGNFLAHCFVVDQMVKRCEFVLGLIDDIFSLLKNKIDF
jgi:hypothetical protein